MTAHATLGPDELVALMQVFRDGLAEHQVTINRLNVFPVPDGDTGTNMLLTVESVLKAVHEAPEPRSLAGVGAAIAQGSLMGAARGNSGVILCQLLRGFAKPCADAERLTADMAVAGLRSGSDAANEAVLRPMAGTILTVAGDAVAAAESAHAAHASLAEVVEAARIAAVASLAETPKQLSVLADAGVVDAGGAGLVVFYDALSYVTSGRAMPATLALPDDVAERIAQGLNVGEMNLDDAHFSSESSLRYEVMYLLEGRDDAIGAFKEVWASIGDSIVIVGGDGLYNCHIHTNDIGGAIEAALDVGRPREIRVTDLDEQVEEERWVREGDHGDGDVASHIGPPPVTSIVAVSSGDGIRRIFRSLGVEHIIAGGQSMNPSTAEFLEMIATTPGKDVVILPNNTNIYPVATQAAELSPKPASVVATAGIQEAFAALLEYDPQASGEDNAKAMATSASRVVPGEVTQAVRATTTPVGDVAPGDFIGLSRLGIAAIASELGDATIGLLAHLLRDEHEIVTLIEGASVPAAELRKVTEWLAAEHPAISVERLQGGQPLYPFLISIE